MMAPPMKSEHRHELQTNTLASFMANLPQTLQKHSSKILTVAAVILLVVAVNNYRKSQREATRIEVQDALAKAWESLDELRAGSPTPATQLEAQIRSAVQKVLDDADPKTDRALLANAWLVTGDMYWALATEVQSDASAPGANSTTPPTTQATTKPASETDHLRKSAEAYQKVVDEYNDQSQQLATARFSLAAIAETRRDFEAARTQYKQLIESSTVTPSHKVMAENRIARLSELEKPLLLLPATRPTSEFGGFDPASMPDELLDTPMLPPGPIGPVGPSTQPAPPSTQPASPSTQPAK